ncbi:MAG: hypothetical protein HY200_10995 [Nitrospirae bacterium]|nr:hypothetical protein [Nitrospirota bacterium]MBI3595472.1 hypothetical protein [Nitrospirota bacterium]
MLNEETIGTSHHSLSIPCPHCQAGRDRDALGLIWDLAEEAWRCLLCGHRSFLQKEKSDEEKAEEKMWDRILSSMAPEESSDHSGDDIEEEELPVHFSG